MCTFSGIRLARLVVLAVALAYPASTFAAERFTFARPAAPESTVDPAGGRLGIDIDRWSTGAERDQLLAAIKEYGPEKLLTAFREIGRIGTLRWPGGLEYPVRYAWRNQRSDGGADIVLVVDRAVWMWWDSSAPSTSYPFSVVQMRVAKDGTGEGRVSLGVNVSSDQALGVVLADYAKAPAVIADLRREQQRGTN